MSASLSSQSKDSAPVNTAGGGNGGGVQPSMGGEISSEVDPSIAAARLEADKAARIHSTSSSNDPFPPQLNTNAGPNTGSPRATPAAGSSSSSSNLSGSSTASTSSSSSSPPSSASAPPVSSVSSSGAVSSPRSVSSSVRPSDGVLHHLKKAFSSSSSHVGEDPVINDSYEKLESRSADLAHLRSSLYDYETLRRQFASAFNQVCQDFVRCFHDPQNPYSSLANQTLQTQQQQQSMMEANSVMPLVDQVERLCADSDQDQQRIRKQLEQRNTKLSDVQYYLSKVDKMKRKTDEKGDQDTPTKPGETSKLDRNRAKYEQIQQEYNQENEQLINGMNESWKNRSLSLGPVLVHFVQKRGAWESQQQQFAQFQNQLNGMSDQQQQQKWHQHYLDSINLVPKHAGMVPETPITQQQKDSYSRTQPQPTDLSSSRLSDSNPGPDVARSGSSLSSSSLPPSSTGVQPSASSSASASGSVSGSESGSESVADGNIGRGPALVELIRWEEQLDYRKESFLRERLHVRKSLATEMVTLSVPVRKERVEVEREIIEPSVASSPSNRSGTGRESEKWNKAEPAARESVPPGEISDARATELGSGDPSQGSSEWDRMKAKSAKDNAGLPGRDADKENRDLKSDLSLGSGPERREEVVMIVHEERPRVVMDWVPVERVVVKKWREQVEQIIEAEVRKEQVELDQSGVQSLPRDPLIV